ncbi:MAG: protoporphyrinogen oxidase HemJ [Pseudobdellovibrionaceae bacterium]
MQDLLLSAYDWLKAIHVIAVIAFMAGMLYLPRLFVYHTKAASGSELSETFKIMERRLLRYIINPAFVVATLFGGLMLWANPELLHMPWMHAKLGLLVLMGAVHGMLSKYRRLFEMDQNTKSEKFFRILNEMPTILMIIIVILVIVRPF